MSNRIRGLVLGQPVEVVTSLEAAADHVLSLARTRPGSYVCFSTAHMLVETQRDTHIHAAYRNAEMIFPDGAPVAWCLKALGYNDAECISGPRLTPVLLQKAAEQGLRVAFYGGRPDTLQKMERTLRDTCPNLAITSMQSPPFRRLTEQEQAQHLRAINDQQPDLLFVGLGSPKQELWMREYAPQVHCVSLGVGAAFEFLAGEKYLPPLVVQRLGLTWLVRLCQEPRRLLRRNLYSPLFVSLFLHQRLLGVRFLDSSLEGNLQEPVSGKTRA